MKESYYVLTFESGKKALLRNRIRNQRLKLEYAYSMLLLSKRVLHEKRLLKIKDFNEIPVEVVAYIGWKTLYKQLSEERRQIKRLIANVNRD